VIKIRSTPTFGGEVETEAPFYSMLKILGKAKFINSFARPFCLLLEYSTGLVLYLFCNFSLFSLCQESYVYGIMICVRVTSCLLQNF
jgi:hypothetical protein